MPARYHRMMRSIDAEEGRRRLQSIGVQVETPGLPRYTERRQCRVFEVDFADHFSAAQDMAHELIAPPAQPSFPGGILWLYGREYCPIADYTFVRFRHGYGIEAGLDDEPALLCEAGEAQDAVAAMGLM